MGRTKTFNREDILKEAIQLFWKKGYVDTSLKDLEKATGVNKSGLYSEFKDKDEIFLESLRYYHEHSAVIEILLQQPLGWDNIARFFQANMICKGQKGCFLTNTLREYSIIPQKVKNLIEQNSLQMTELVLNNILATKTKKDPELLTKMILTFASGISLKLNVMKPEMLQEEIEAFLTLVKN